MDNTGSLDTPKKIDVLGEAESQNLIEIFTNGLISDGKLMGAASMRDKNEYFDIDFPISDIQEAWVTYTRESHMKETLAGRVREAARDLGGGRQDLHG